MLAGDKLLVCGQAKDIAEANYILDILRANVPGAELSPRNTGHVGARAFRVDRLNPETDPRLVSPGGGPPGILDYPLSGGPLIVNLLRVPGEQQVQLQVTVAEVNRAAARTIGLNFNIFNRARHPGRRQQRRRHRAGGLRAGLRTIQRASAA